MLLTSQWLPALTRSDVTLVSGAASAVTPRGLVADDGTEHPADVIIFETVPSAAEVEALTSLAKDLELPAILSLSVRADEHGNIALGDGTNLRQVAKIVQESGVWAGVGVNCCPVPVAVEALKILGEETGLPLSAYPNSGEIWDHEARVWRPGAEGTDLPSAVPELVAAGARLIGGCCQVSPEQITRVREAAQLV